MIKAINYGEGQSFEINSSNGWLYIYQEQFGHDVLPVLLPAVEALIQAIADLMKSTKENTDDLSEILKSADSDTISDMFITLSGMQLTTVLNIVWSMAKNAKNDIAPPQEWVNSFDVLPWDIVVPQALSAALEACISKKKFDTIRTTLGKLSPSVSSESQSQPSIED